jgi:hypothetical protein
VIEELKTIEQNEAWSVKLKDDPASEENIRKIEANYSKLLQGIEITLFYVRRQNLS